MYREHLINIYIHFNYISQLLIDDKFILKNLKFFLISSPENAFRGTYHESRHNSHFL